MRLTETLQLSLDLAPVSVGSRRRGRIRGLSGKGRLGLGRDGRSGFDDKTRCAKEGEIVAPTAPKQRRTQKRDGALAADGIRGIKIG